MKKLMLAPLALFASVAIAADSATPIEVMMKSSFQANGIASLDRQTQDEVQRACSSPNLPDAATMKRLEEAEMKTIQWPANGDYYQGGDWREGQKIALSGRGLTWTDTADTVNGGGCYNCHGLDPANESYGTIGPALHGYAKLRGNSEDVLKYTWGKLWNSKAYNACSNMPRNGFGGILTEVQIRHVMAYLFDPASPVNK
ncbi:MAG: sulfur oxidation c-type cytochrome SoxX [Zoogloeaceae bacterium]|nr:sulfur oxidation c-type cytochrome SoxX [Zoogloeaceae bacterium]